MKRKLRPVEVNRFQDQYILYQLLGERESFQSISHKMMPTMSEHIAFVQGHPYEHWYMVVADHVVVGATYLTPHNEIGIGIFKAHQGKGHAKWALEELMRTHAGPFYANINPNNHASIALFSSLGFNLLQETYSHE